ncbi:ammonia-dependent NAD(+) synthetase [Bacillus spongiae]|uniref:NH(3)-dependent NAD(+) synthetase n=1 Tax=Bacillus spongiae TaxID=2683610 RepID=A0ABU8HF89_9BACI
MDSIQKEIISEMRVKPVIDAREEIERSVQFLKDYLLKNNSIKSLVLGISGGQDSTLTGKIAQMAINELRNETGDDQYSFIAVRLPYGTQGDESDCHLAIKFIQPTKVYTINIKPAVDASVQSLKVAGVKISDFLKGNEKARERMKVQYSIAGYHNGVVLGTDHSSEAVTGFFTKHGDGACDLVPLFRLNKRQGKLLLQELGCPEQLYLKAPTADLEDEKPQLPDEVALRVTYEEIDDFLEGKKISEKAANQIVHHWLKTKHKRSAAISVFADWWIKE